MNPMKSTPARRLALASTLLLASCAASNPVLPPVDSSYRIEVTESFDALPNYTRLYFQQGQRVIQGNLDRWEVYCRIHVFNRERQADYRTELKPGTFTISRVENRRTSSRYESPGTRAFSLSGEPVGLVKASFGGDGFRDPPAYYLYGVVMQLSSARQPDVQNLVCARKWATYGDDYYSTLEEIRRALGDSVRIQPSDA